MASIESLLDRADLPESPSPRLDAELLLAAALGKPRSYLRTWPEREPEAAQQACFQAYLQRRRAGEPVAYILGQQGFWSLHLEVAAHTLIPRPDTELLVESALQLLGAGLALWMTDTTYERMLLAMVLSSPSSLSRGRGRGGYQRSERAIWV